MAMTMTITLPLSLSLLLSGSLLILLPVGYGQNSCGRHSSSYFDNYNNYIAGGRFIDIADSVVSLQVLHLISSPSLHSHCTTVLALKATP